MAATKTSHSDSRKGEYLKKKDFFRRNAFLIIQEMVGMSPGQHSVLVDEVLHSIFFLGEINTPKYRPKDIVSDDDILNVLKVHYPEPFKYYTSQLPKRSPISCVLDMIINLTGEEREKEIITRLQKLIVELKRGEATELIASTICVSQLNKTQQETERHYGVSMSTSGRIPGRIMIGASCLTTWDSYVADAVMTYYPNKTKKAYFDGTIKLPEYVRCQAFNVSAGKLMPPCRSCGNLFGLTTSEKQEWPYGNCAEVESVSNLLRNDRELKEKVRPTSETHNLRARERARESVLKELKQCLRNSGINWDEEFYTPRGV